MPNIAIIGSGTGLTTAWALADSPDMNVTVLEASDRLGGHINSFKVERISGRDGKPMRTNKTICVEGGAEFIGPKAIYPDVHKLFDTLGIELDKYQLTLDFQDIDDDNDHTVLPPYFRRAVGRKGNKPLHLPSPKDIKTCFISFFSQGKVQKDFSISFSTLVTELCELVHFKVTIDQAKASEAAGEDVMTLEEFINARDFLGIKKYLAEKILYPVCAAGWGVPVETIKTFCAHYAMKYLAAGTEWYDAPKGLSSYIDALEKQCDKVKIQKKQPVARVVPVKCEDGKTRYQLVKQKQGKKKNKGQPQLKIDEKNPDYVLDDTGKPALYDNIVITPSAELSWQMLQDIDLAGVQALVETLKKVTYYDTTVVFHQDQSYHSPHNTIVHTRYENGIAANTACKDWKFPVGAPVMKTWVLDGQKKPEKKYDSDFYKEVHYRHPIMDINYYNAQKALHEFQGTHGIRFGGILAGHDDSHQSGVSVALQNAAEICYDANCLEENERLAIFPDTVQAVLSAHPNHPVPR